MSDIRICPVCGKEFVRHHKQKYCSEKCRNEYWRRPKTRTCQYCLKPYAGSGSSYCSTECRLKANGQMPDDAIDIQRFAPTLSLAEVIALAKAEGLTYGQYIMKHKLK